MRKVEFTARPVSCSVNPLTFDREPCIGCGQCAPACPVKGAIHLRHPLMNQTKFVETRAAGEQAER